MPETTQKRTWEWDERRLLAVELIADGRLADAAIAGKVGISRTALCDWKKRPEFISRVNELTAAMEERVLVRGVARRARRIQAKNNRWMGLKKVINKRAADPDMANVPGGKSGLLVHTNTKVIGSGENAREVKFYAVDTGLVTAMLALEQAAAIECGQWTEKRDVTKHSDAKTRLDLTKLTDEQLRQLDQVMTAATAGKGENARDNPDAAAE